MVLFLGLAGVSSGVLLSLTTIRLHRASDAMKNAVASVRAAEELDINLLTYSKESQLLDTTGDPIHHLNRQRARAALSVWANEIERYSGSPAEDEIIEQVQQEILHFLAMRDRLEKDGGDPQTIVTEMNPALDRASSRIESLIAFNTREAQENHQRIVREDRVTNLAGLGFVALVISSLVGALVLNHRFVFRPLLALRESIHRYGRSQGAAPPAPEVGPAEVRDISRAFNEMAQHLREQQNSRLRFLSYIAHDLRNPLAAIQMGAGLLSASPELPEERRRQILAAIDRQVGHLDRIVGDLLDMTRIEAGQLELKPELLDLREVAQASLDLFRSASDRHELSATLPEHAVHVLADPVRLGQVLNNLLSNAIKYSPAGGPIRIALAEQGGQAVLSVADQGLGIDGNDLPHIFEPFRRTAATRSAIPGVGLGLSVSRRIVEAHGGRITAQSPAAGASSIFFVQLPLHAAGERRQRDDAASRQHVPENLDDELLPGDREAQQHAACAMLRAGKAAGAKREGR